MTAPPKTIQIFLPAGDPQGIRVAEITTRIMRVIEVPRSLLNEFLAMPEANQVALYFLFGEEDDTDQRVYIGQTGDLKSRMRRHNAEKDFWERALIVVSLTNNLTQTHAVFLEWYCLTECREAGRCADENGNAGSRPHTPAPMEADCIEIFDTAKTLLSTLGYPVFTPVASAESKTDEQELFYCRGSEADARGLYTSEGFVVLAGSSGRTNTTASFEKWNLGKSRDSLLESGVLKEIGGRLVFQKDHLFKTPSRAAIIVMGRNANGWTEWRDEHGRTLDELKRQTGDEDS
ncbi:GIY-YIG nuclease family protein [Aeoliella sp. ICT_H6.2]|uniref:GIY-YIG nuclease family protein n=1 Tax=Aeoliella straminimaris TaxID=2954799 RepID=A0A9X2JF43_9BACT|nr:GIY-YIG nuclease family protein [Aeoliella straminimaris]MCO6043316.1 GIY-YIG nuclease family protein [Aeoliella straminimaris]